MKPKKFVPGQAVTPTHKRFVPIDNNRGDSPKFGHVYHIKKYELFDYGEWWVSLDEMDNGVCYEEWGLAPVITTHELESELSEIEITVAI